MGNSHRFAGKRVIVTGAASGIGRASTIRLVSEGATVLAVDLNADGLSETVSLSQSVATETAKARLVVADVADEQSAKQIVADMVNSEGGLDALVNMAGVLRSVHTTDETLPDFMRIISINLVGTFLWCREALPHLEETGGSIVNAASTSSFFGHPYMAAYAASKGGIAALTHTLAWEYIKRGVRVNAIAPGGIATPMVAAQQSAFPAGADLTLFAHLTRPDLTFGKPEDIAGVIAMLASDDGRYINGEIVRVDGGVHS